MQTVRNRKVFKQYSLVLISVLILSIVSVNLLSVSAHAAEPEPGQTVSGQELPDQIQVNPEADPTSGLHDNFNKERTEMMSDLLSRLDYIIELLELDDSEPAAVNLEDINIMYPDGYQDWPYPVRVRYSITCYGYTSESAEDCGSPEDFKTSFRNNVMRTVDGTFQSFSLRYVLALDENAAEGELVYDYNNPVYHAPEEPEEIEDEEQKELSFAELLSDVQSIDEKLSDMQEDNQQFTVSGNNLISNLDDTIQEGNQENRQMITDLFTQGITYILAFIGIVVGCIVGLILSRYLKHD